MAFSTLSLSTTSGVQGRPYRAVLSGLQAGSVIELGADGAPGFSYVNGRFSSDGLPYPTSTLAFDEIRPGEGRKSWRFDITAAGAPVQATAADGTITYSGAGGAPTAQAATATASGPVYTITRLLGSSSTLALITGTNGNLTLSGNVVSATTAIGVGVSQTAVVSETNGSLRVDYPVVVTGVSSTPGTNPTLGTLTLGGTLAQGSAASGVSITGATTGSTITLGIAGLTVSGSGATRVVSGTPTTSGSLSATETLADAIGSPKASIIGNVGAALPTAAPLAPTLTASGGDGQAILAIADDPASQQVQKWAVYEATTSGGTQQMVGWVYTKDQLTRRFLANGSTRFYRVAAWNAFNGGSEGPKSAEVSATAAAANFNPLRMLGVMLFTNTLFYEPIGADFKAGSTVAVTASDGTALQTKTQNGAVIVYGTFTTAGTKTLTYTETTSGGATNVSTQTITVAARPVAASYAQVKTTAQALKARQVAKPTYATGALTITDTGTSMPAGYTQSKIVLPGKSIYPPAIYTAISNFAPGQFGVNGYDPVEAIPVTNQTTLPQSNSANNGVLRFKSFKQTHIVSVSSDGGTSVAHLRARYSDDGMATWTEQSEPLYTRFTSGNHFLKMDSGSVPGPDGRIFEYEFSDFSLLNNGQFVNGFGYESGDTPLAVADNSPIIVGSHDSFANGIGATDTTRNMGRTAARSVGLLNFWNLSIPSHRYTFPATSSFPIGLDQIAYNVFGVANLDMPPKVDAWLPNITINDFAQADLTQAQAMFTNILLKARHRKSAMLISLSLGFWAPQDRIPANLLTVIRAAFADASGNGADKGMRLNDGVAEGWAIPSGATGSSPYFFASNSQAITASTTGSVMTVTAGSGIEVGMYLFNGATDLRTRVLKQLTGTAGGAGTYQLQVQPQGGDIASTGLIVQSENYTTGYPVHPNPAGHVWAGQRMADGLVALTNDVVANAP